jgi:uncharacterized membrane protein YccF (DUF307 family)
MSATVVIQPSAGPGFLVRAIWFVLIGWWLSALAIAAAYFAAITVIGLPLAFYVFNRIPMITTLRGRTQNYETTQVGETTLMRAKTIAQRPMWVRVVYFILVGWWLGAVWLAVAWFLSITIIGLPIAVLMYDRVGGIMTLLRY